MTKTKTNKSQSKKLEIIATQPMVSDLGALLRLTAHQISSFAEVVNTKEGYGLAKETSLAELVRSLGVTGDQFEQFYKVSKFYYGKAAESECSFSDLFAVIKEIASKYGLPSPSRKKAALQQLFAVSAEYRKKQKVGPYKQGLLKNIAAIAYTHEIRGVFYPDSDDDSGEIMGFVPVVTVRVVVEDEKENRDTLLFTANERSLDVLIDKLKSAQRKLAEIKDIVKNRKVNLL